MTLSMPDQVEKQSTDITVDPAAYTSEGPGAFLEMGFEAVASRCGSEIFWLSVNLRRAKWCDP
ncbi:hypothetical protein [Rhizobium sp. C4]|uniref:hypothetical protein n=1 Tax=Rhizobium sp. C4 TaxID=1349800 RepID=UPI001E3EA7D8|nr:hypothetical protein [Rhizobium sp. C4]MCD2173264.1 hypothetical protein [Rhizobium sp. C4]